MLDQSGGWPWWLWVIVLAGGIAIATALALALMRRTEQLRREGGDGDASPGR